MLSQTCKFISKKFLSNYIFYKPMYNKYVLSYSYYSTINTIDKNIIDNYVNKLENEYKLISERKTSNTISEKRLRELSPVIQIVQQKNQLLELLESLGELLKENDEEMKKLAENEKKAYEVKLCAIEQDLVEALVPVDSADFCDSIYLEINAGVGGQEAMLFAYELFEMYTNYAEFKNWNCEIVEFDKTDIGGVRHASILISGPEVFKYFKYEAGVHRVQRIPTTERAGRVHTSTVSVVALPQPRDIDVTMHDKDLRIETKRASGAGGQHVNTTDSAVRIVHLPTGMAVECQVDRSQIKNREMAMQRLKAKLYDQQMTTQLAESEATRKSQVRSNFRNEKIRTYNYSQDRITDHRLQSSNLHNLKGFLLGGQQLDNLIDKLHETAQYDSLMQVLKSSK